MFPEVAAFRQWLHRKSPHSSTSADYGFDLKTFFDWAKKPPRAITLRDVDAFIGYCQDRKLAVGTINRRLCALRSFYTFLEIELVLQRKIGLLRKIDSYYETLRLRRFDRRCLS